MATRPVKEKKKRALEIDRVIKAVDQKNYDFYKQLNEAELKEFAPYVLMRFTSNVRSDQAVQEWFIESTNELVNKNFWDLSKSHKELLWKLYAATGVGTSAFHQYLGAGKNAPPVKIEKLIADLNPSMKMADVRLLASLMNDKEKSALLDSMGFDKKDRKDYE